MKHSNFLEDIFSLSHSILSLYFFALITEEGFLISSCYSLELCIQMGISFLFSFAFSFSSFFSFFFNECIYFQWSLITLQYCVFCHTLTWISHGCTWVPVSLTPLPLPSYPIPLGSQLFVRSPQTTILYFMHFLFLGMVLITASCAMSWTSVHSSSGSMPAY